MSIRGFVFHGLLLHDKDPVSSLDMLAADHWRTEIQSCTGDRGKTEAYMAVAARLAMLDVPVDAIDQFAINHAKEVEREWTRRFQ